MYGDVSEGRTCQVCGLSNLEGRLKVAVGEMTRKRVVVYAGSTLHL